MINLVICDIQKGAFEMLKQPNVYKRLDFSHAGPCSRKTDFVGIYDMWKGTGGVAVFVMGLTEP